MTSLADQYVARGKWHAMSPDERDEAQAALVAALRASRKAERERLARARQEMRGRLTCWLLDYASKIGAIYDPNAEEFADQMIADGWTDE
jgi:hypothetical protein